jgi:hypothetical protein
MAVVDDDGDATQPAIGVGEDVAIVQHGMEVRRRWEAVVRIGTPGVGQVFDILQGVRDARAGVLGKAKAIQVTFDLVGDLQQVGNTAPLP